MRHALVVIVGDEIVDILFEIRAGAADRVDFVLADHFRERQAKLGGAHGAGKRHKHLAALGNQVRYRLRPHQSATPQLKWRKWCFKKDEIEVSTCFSICFSATAFIFLSFGSA